MNRLVELVELNANRRFVWKTELASDLLIDHNPQKLLMNRSFLPFPSHQPVRVHPATVHGRLPVLQGVPLLLRKAERSEQHSPSRVAPQYLRSDSAQGALL